MHRFFNRSPEVVARELEGKYLQLGETSAEILSVLAQNEQDNTNWIESRPLFGSHPVDVYVASYRGNCMLFLRTGPTNTCVRINQIRIDGKTYINPGQACKALGISREQTGKFSFTGRAVKILLS